MTGARGGHVQSHVAQACRPDPEPQEGHFSMEKNAQDRQATQHYATQIAAQVRKMRCI